MHERCIFSSDFDASFEHTTFPWFNSICQRVRYDVLLELPSPRSLYDNNIFAWCSPEMKTFLYRYHCNICMFIFLCQKVFLDMIQTYLLDQYFVQLLEQKSIKFSLVLHLMILSVPIKQLGYLWTTRETFSVRKHRWNNITTTLLGCI